MDDVSPKSLRARLWRARWGLALLTFGVALILLSLLPSPGPDAAWARDALLTVGGSLALFGPLYLVNRTLDRHLDETKEQVQSVRTEAAARSDALSSEVEELRENVGQRLEEVEAAVTARLEAKAEADREAFAVLRAEIAREDIMHALSRAHENELVSTWRWPRVRVAEGDRLYVSFGYTPDFDELLLHIETVDGTSQEFVEWPSEATTTDVLVSLGEALSRYSSEKFSPIKLFAGLADLLEAANSHIDRRLAVELCPPQWMVCERAIVTAPGPPEHPWTTPLRDFSVQKIREDPAYRVQVSRYGWVDPDSFDEACFVAMALFRPEVGWPATR